MTHSVYLYFMEGGTEVYELVRFGDQWAAESYLASCGGEISRGGRRVPLTRARIVDDGAAVTERLLDAEGSPHP